MAKPGRALKPQGRARGTSKGAKAKNPAAVALGSKGGKKGGPARARALSGSKRSAIARHAANTKHGNRTAYQKPAYYQRKVTK